MGAVDPGRSDGFAAGQRESRAVEAMRVTKWMAVIARELKSVGLVTLYFLACFGVILTLKKLFLENYNIETSALSTAIVSALIAAKVVVTLDHTRAGTRFDASRTLVTAASYKTLVYGLVAFAFLAGERLFHAWREHGDLATGFVAVWEQRNRNVIIAKVICVALTFAGYHLYTGIDRRLGEGTLWRMLGTRAPSSGERRGGQAQTASTVDSAAQATRKETTHGRSTEAQHPRHLG